MPSAAPLAVPAGAAAVAPSVVPTAISGEEEAGRVVVADAVGIVAPSAAGGGTTEKWMR